MPSQSNQPTFNLIRWLVYIFKYAVYLLNLLVWKIRVSKPVIWLNKQNLFVKSLTVISFVTIVLVLTLNSFIFSRFIDRSKPISLRSTFITSSYQFSGQSSEISLNLGEKSTNQPKVEIVSPKGGKISFNLSENSKQISNPTQEGNTVTYQNVQPNLDLRYTTLSNGLKEEIILKSKPTTNSFVFNLNLDGAVPKKSTNNTDLPIFFNSKGEYLFQMRMPFAVDASGATTYIGLLEIKDGPKPNTYQATVSIDQAWLLSPNRQYPIVIDPTIVYDTSTAYSYGTMNRILDSGSGSTPNLTVPFFEHSIDPYTVALWHLNEASGDIYDSVSGLASTPVGTTVTTSLLGLGNARSFNGSANDIITANMTPFHTIKDFTLEAWVKTNNLNQTAIAVARGGGTTGFGFGQSNGAGSATGKVFTAILPNVTWINCNYTFTGTTVWHHLAISRDSTVFRCYVDGVLTSTTLTTNNPIITTTNNVTIGSETTGGRYFNGSVDEVRLSSIARSPDEIREAASRRPYGVFMSEVLDLGMYPGLQSISWNEGGVRSGNDETPATTSGLVAFWKLNESSGTTAYNDSNTLCGSSCDAPLLNFPSTSYQDQTATTGWTSINKLFGTGSLMFSTGSLEINDNDILDISTGITIESWVKIKSNSIWHTILAKGEGSDNTGKSYELWINQTTTAPLFRLHTGSTNYDLECGISVRLYEWTHVAATWDGSTMKAYVNGVSCGETAFPGPLRVGTEKLVIGRRKSTSSTYQPSLNLIGDLDNIRLYNRALSQNEIVANYATSNLEIQTRYGNSLDPNDGTWSVWGPTTSEVALSSMDSDSANWSWDSSTTKIPQTKSDDSFVKQEGTGSLKISTGTMINDANTVGYWTFNETSGTTNYLKDISANGYHGTPNGTTTVKGMVGQGLSFNGTSNYITTTSPGVTGTTNRTFEAWIKTSSATDVEIAYWGTETNGGRFEIKTASGLLQVKVNGGQINSTNKINDGKWHHIAVVLPGTNINTGLLYIDGNLETNTSVSAQAINTGTSTVRIGYDPVGGATFFNGIIDEVRLSNIVRTPEEISENYRNGRDHYLNRTISSNDFSDATNLQFKIASDRPGTYLQTIIGETDFANYQPNGDTLALWHLDESTYAANSIRDAKGTYHGTGSGLFSSPGVLGLSQNFTAGDDIALGNVSIVDNLANFTIDAWVYPTTQTANTHFTIFTENNVLSLSMYSAQASVRMGNGSSYTLTETSGGTIGNLNWTHVAWVKSGTNYYIYLNGVLSKSGSTAPATLGTSTNVNYISTTDGTTTPWLGNLDEVRISSVAYSADQIRDIYFSGRRIHNISFDFSAKLDSNNLISDVNDTQFIVDATGYGLAQKGTNIYPGDKIIIRENYNGTYYVAQGTVNSVNSSTGAVTVASWDANSTFPSVGYSINADVFKWQTVYSDVSKIDPAYRDAITKISFRLLNGAGGHNIWIDDIKASGAYLSTPSGTLFTHPFDKKYLQYRAIFSSSDPRVSASLNSPLNISYESLGPSAPTGLTGTPTATSINWTFTDATPTKTQGYVINEGNTLIASYSGQVNNSYNKTGLTPNTTYSYKVAAWNGYGPSLFSSPVSVTTLAATPSSSFIRGDETATISAVTNNNPINTEYAIFRINTQTETCTAPANKEGVYIKADGSSSSDIVWRTLSESGTATVSGLSPSEVYTFCLKARNSDNIATSFSSPDHAGNTGYIAIGGDLTIDVPLNQNFVVKTRFKDPIGNNLIALDNGTGPTNTSVLNMKRGVLTLSANETLVVGEIKMTGGSIATGQPTATVGGLYSGAKIILGKHLYADDVDQDLYPDDVTTLHFESDNTKTLVTNVIAIRQDCDNTSALANTSCSRWYPDSDGDGKGDFYYSEMNYVGGAGFVNSRSDCNDNSSSVYQVTSCYTDSDGDTYGAGTTSQVCLGSNDQNHRSVTCNDATHKSAPGLGQTVAVNANLSTVNTDCNDNNINIYQNQTLLVTDADRDGYGVWNSTSSTQCVGDTANYSGRTYYKDSSGNFSRIKTTSLAAGINSYLDCSDTNANVYYGSTSCLSNTFTNDATPSATYDYNCNNNAEKCGTSYTHAVTSGNLSASFTCGNCTNCHTCTNSVNRYPTQTTFACGEAAALCTGTDGLESGGKNTCSTGGDCIGGSIKQHCTSISLSAQACQ